MQRNNCEIMLLINIYYYTYNYVFSIYVYVLTVKLWQLATFLNVCARWFLETTTSYECLAKCRHTEDGQQTGDKQGVKLCTHKHIQI